MSELIQRFTINNDGGIVSVAFIPVPSGGGGGDLLAANNLSDLVSASSARTNLGLGSAAITSTSAYATSAQGTKADSALQPAGSGSALTGMTKAQVGLGNVDNTSDAAKPISTATQAALDGKQVAGSYATGTGSASGTNTGDNAVNTLYSGLATSKQDTLVSATNIKTINGATVLGAGDLVVSGAAPAFTAFTKDLGAARCSGTFDITGLSGLTSDKVVLVVQTAAPIASKGNARDEPEFDQITATGYVVNSSTIRAYWNAPGVVVGTYAFAYQVSG